MRSVTVLALAFTLALAAGPAFAGTAFIGATFGVDVFNSNGQSTTLLSAPSASDAFFVGPRPGLRFGGITEDGHDMGFVDTSFMFVSSQGLTFHSVLGTLNYAHVFGEAPYITFGGGLGNIGGDGSSESVYSVGAGVGVRHLLSHGHGAFRFELRYDNMNLTEGDSDALNIFGIKFGFDLMGS